jgi:hypothetical protein
MSLRSPTEHENGSHSQNMLPSSIRHSRARGNPGLFCAELAWMPAFAGMTDPLRLFVVHIIASHVFSKKVTKDRRARTIKVPNFVLFVLLSVIICAACANCPGAETPRIRIFLAPRPPRSRSDRPEACHPEQMQKILRRISLSVRNDNVLPLRPLRALREIFRNSVAAAPRWVLRGENCFIVNPQDRFFLTFNLNQQQRFILRAARFGCGQIATRR